MGSFVVKMKLDRVTQKSALYKETVAYDQQKAGQLYFKQRAFEGGKVPDSIEVEVRY